MNAEHWSHYQRMLEDYARNPGRTFSVEDLEHSLQADREAVLEFVHRTQDEGLVLTRRKERIRCPTIGCQEQAQVVEDGQVACSRGHMNRVDPANLEELTLDISGLTDALVEALTGDGWALEPFDKNYRVHDLQFLSRARAGDFTIDIALQLSNLNLGRAFTLLGLSNILDSDLMLVFTNSFENDALDYLSTRLYGALIVEDTVHVLRGDWNTDEFLKGIVSMEGHVRLQGFLRRELSASVRKVLRPEEYQRLIAFDADIIDGSARAATTGRRDDLEDYVYKLLGVLGFPITPLGKTYRGVALPDGLIEVLLYGHQPAAYFYDCKSAGSTENPRETYKISEEDEDRFVKYVGLFNQPKVAEVVSLEGGIFICNEFSTRNLQNKVKDIRTKLGSGDPRIIAFSLRTLTSLYVNIIENQARFRTRFDPTQIRVLFGVGLSQKELKSLEDNEASEINAAIAPSNAFYVHPDIGRIFFERVMASEPREIAIPQLLERAREL